MEPRLLFFASVVVLVLLSGRSVHSQESIVDDPQHSTEGVKLFWKWWGLLNDVHKGSTQREIGGPCSASVEQTYAYLLLNDLFFDFKSNGTIDYLLQRKPFYTEQFDGILVDAIRQNVSFCLRPHIQPVCDSSSNTCVECSSTAAKSEPKLNQACRFYGKGGEDAETVALIPGELPEADRLSRPPLGEDEGACGKGWLSAEDARKWHTTITAKEDYQRRGPFTNCSMNVEAAVAFALLQELVNRDATNATALETEIAKYGDWWEDQLWVFRGGNHTNLAFCRQFHPSGGRFVCGKDGICDRCVNVILNNVTELYAACPTEGGGGRPENVKTRAENCADSKLTTSTEGSGNSGGNSSTESEGYGTTESRSVGTWPSPLPIAVAVFFHRLNSIPHLTL